jgi:hypothetical protein
LLKIVQTTTKYKGFATFAIAARIAFSFLLLKMAAMDFGSYGKKTAEVFK